MKFERKTTLTIIDQTPWVPISDMPDGAYVCMDSEYIAIKNAPGGFRGLDMSESSLHSHLILGIGPGGCGPITGDHRGRWIPIPIGTVIKVQWTV